MELQVQRCAGIDIGKADVKVCVRRPGARGGRRVGEVRTFSTTTRGLLRMVEWLVEEHVTRVGMESTGVYWKPVYYLLETVLPEGECWLLNPTHLKKVPGRKSDVSDAAWIAQLVEYGLVRPSFVPPPQVRRLRDLTRYRTSLVHDRTRESQRLHDVLEDAGIKLSLVASDIFGVSGRAMLAALIEGQRDPERLADLARARMRSKIPALTEALTGQFTDHHALMCRLMLDRIDTINATIDELDTEIETAMAPFQPIIDRLKTIPGVADRVAQVIVAETGADMSRFPTPADLSSWAGMCPGNNESAGKHFTGRTRHGDPWLRGALGEAAIAASRTRDTYLSQRYQRLAHRRGKKRALVAVGRTILESAWHMITNDADYRDLGPHYYLTHTDQTRRTQRLIAQLQQLGYNAVPTQAA